MSMAKAITWREANFDDVGRLARFADVPGDDWTYGIIEETDNLEGVFLCVQTEGDYGEGFHICEVQEVSP